MAHSVESRVPFLDLELVRFAARIPDHVRFGEGMKGVLKHTLRGVLPDRVLDKKKWGFTFDPVEQYDKDLGTMARDLLTPARLAESGVFNPEFVRRVLQARPTPAAPLALLHDLADDRRRAMARHLHRKDRPLMTAETRPHGGERQGLLGVPRQQRVLHGRGTRLGRLLRGDRGAALPHPLPPGGALRLAEGQPRAAARGRAAA